MPRVIHVCGPWGAGKSTLMSAIRAGADSEETIDSVVELAFGSHRLAWIDAFSSAGVEVIIDRWRAGRHVIDEHPRSKISHSRLLEIHGETQNSMSLVVLETDARACVDGLVARAVGARRFPTIERLRSGGRDPVDAIRGYVRTLEAFIADAENAGVRVLRVTRSDAVEKVLNEIYSG